jgi:prohibitin 1
MVTYPTVFDVRVRPRIVSSRTGTKDLQQVQISLRILSRPKPEALPEIMINLGEDWDERVLPSIVNEVLKATVAQYDAEQLLTEREAVSRKIRVALEKRAGEFNIILEDVSITHLMFSKEFTTAIESKQVAQQDAERSKFVVQKAEQEKLAVVILAEGEGEAAELISNVSVLWGWACFFFPGFFACFLSPNTLTHSYTHEHTALVGAQVRWVWCY